MKNKKELNNKSNSNFVELKDFEFDLKAIEKISETIAKRYMIVPIKILDNSILIATNDPSDLFVLDDIKLITNLKPIPIYCNLQDIKEAINIYYGAKKINLIADEFEKELEEKKNKSSFLFENKKFETNTLNAPAVKLVNSIIEQAVIKNASDIHIEPFNDYVRIRIRIDSQLQEILKLDISTLNGIVTRIKILGNMDISERRMPQDGHIDMKSEDLELDLRISTLPTIYGEKVVIRIIYKDKNIINKENIGFLSEDLEKFNKLIMNTNGIILITGPTGSGKSTTLFSAIKELNKENINIVTVEDPVENIIEGINQININTKIGLDFPQALRSILRQDPNIVMIGEIRDYETASIAIKAGITGHLVLSTLHTNDSISSIIRLIDMGIEKYMVATAIRGVIAQRLVRKVCSICCEDIEISKEDAKFLNISKDTIIKKAVGCKNCNYTGYKGRFAVYEINTITTDMKQAILNGFEYENLKQIAVKNGMNTIHNNTVKNIINGKTTIEELYRVTYIQE